MGGGLLTLTLLGGLSLVLHSAGGAIFGLRYATSQALSSGIGLVVLALFSFLGLPALILALQEALPASGGCGPILELGGLAAGLIAAFGSLRLLLAMLSAAGLALAGAGPGAAQVLFEAAEAVLGMVLASLAAPLAAHFLGAC